MPSERSSDVKFEIGHVLFLDIVGYSKLLIHEQSEQLQTLKEIVRGTEQFRLAEAEGKLLRLPTGDGGALVFRNSPEAPVRCALETSQALKSHPEVRVRMGIHSGPVNEVTDLNEQANVAGAGINMAQRVMDCGDAGHILLSKHVADDLEQYSQWRSHLHELGECEVKHGVRVSIVNLYTAEVGNPELPERFKHGQAMWPGPFTTARGRRWAIVGAAALIIAVLALAFLISRSKPASPTASSATPPKPTTVAAIEKSIAVLPFENLSSDKENAYFADGVQDEILTDLSKIADLKVISRSSVMHYKSGVERNLRQIGQQLGVAHLLEGSVQRAANRIRVNAQLIDARTDAHLWAQTYDRDLADVFAIQSEIAKTIADQLRVQISPREKAAMAQAPTTDLEANKLYVQAKELEGTAADPNAKQNLLKAARLLEEAVRRDPHFLLAYCWLSRVHLDLYWLGFDHTPARRELANAAIQAASRLQPDAGEVHVALASYAYWGFRDYDRARAELDLARSTLPNNVDIYFFTALIDRRQARWTETMRNWERAVELDPRNFLLLGQAGITYKGLRLYPQSSRLLERAVAISPHDYFSRTVLALNPGDERADTRPLRATLSTILTEEPGASEKIAYGLFYCAMRERDSAATARALTAIPSEGLGPDPREWFVGLAARTFGDAAKAHSAFTAARAILEKVVRDQPDYEQAWSQLGVIDAGLGRKDDAVREGRRACELLPLSKDSWDGPYCVTTLAIIYAWTGDKDSALEQLAISAQVPAGVTYGELKLDPQFDPLRGDPRFEKIVGSLAPKDAKP